MSEAGAGAGRTGGNAKVRRSPYRLDDVTNRCAVYCVPVGSFPVAEGQLEQMRELVKTLVTQVKRSAPDLRDEVILQQKGFYTGLLNTFLDRMTVWKAQQGLVVLPHSPPPHIPTKAEVDNVDPRTMGDDPGAALNAPQFAFRIRNTAALEECRDMMCGHGALHVFLTRLNEKDLLSRWKDVFAKGITSRLFRAMPLFVPVFTKQSFQQAPQEVLTWFQLFDVYVGESREDEGLLIAARQELGATIDQALEGFSLVQSGQEEDLRW